MQKRGKRNIIFIVVLVVLLAAAGIGFHAYRHPDVRLPLTGDHTPVVITGRVPADIRDGITQWQDSIIGVYTELRDTYAGYSVTYSTAVSGKTTTVTFSGTATDKAGKTVDFSRVIELPFKLYYKTSF